MYGALLVFDITEEESFVNVEKWLWRMREYCLHSLPDEASAAAARRAEKSKPFRTKGKDFVNFLLIGSKVLFAVAS